MAEESLVFKLDRNNPDKVLYQRMEPSPFSEKFERNLGVEVRDAHWMLFRQWQVGEFFGEDAGRACKVQIAAAHQSMNYLHTQAHEDGFMLRGDVPLEALVEAEQLFPDLRVRLQLGNLFKLLLSEAGLSAHFHKFIQVFPLSKMTKEDLEHLEEDPEAFLLFSSLKDTALDGYSLYQSLRENSNQLEIEGVSPNNPVYEQYMQHVALRYNLQPSLTPDAHFWKTDQLEYQFGLADKEKAATAQLQVKQYSEGSLDWYHFDLAAAPSHDALQKRAYIPTPFELKHGMPINWWGIEEGSFNLAKVLVKDTGLLDALFLEFALNHSNDWFVVPYELDINTLCTIKSLIVTDVFGIKYLVRGANEQPENQYGWSIFSQTGSAAEQVFYLAPALLKSEESKPLEQVYFLRDEAANLVWAIQEIIPTGLGKGKSGYETARLSEEHPVVEQNDKMKYVLGTKVPKNWRPFLPVSLDPNQKEMILQRARMPEDESPPLGVLLVENTTQYLYQNPKEGMQEKLSEGYFIREEAIPRAGIQVTRHYQRARWINGEVITWIGRKKKVGKGEGNSGLAFDQLGY